MSKLFGQFFSSSSGRDEEESFLPHQGGHAMDQTGIVADRVEAPYLLSNDTQEILRQRDNFFVDLISALNACNAPLHNSSGARWVIDVATNKKLGNVRLLDSTYEAKAKRRDADDDDGISSYSRKTSKSRDEKEHHRPLLAYSGKVIDVKAGSYAGHRFTFYATMYSISLSYDFEAFLEANPMLLPEGMSSGEAPRPQSGVLTGKKVVGFVAGSGSMME
jgi:hypothetical protein